MNLKKYVIAIIAVLLFSSTPALAQISSLPQTQAVNGSTAAPDNWLMGFVYHSSPPTTSTNGFQYPLTGGPHGKLLTAPVDASGNEFDLSVLGVPGDAAWVSGNATWIAIGKAEVAAINGQIPPGTNFIGYTSPLPVASTASGALEACHVFKASAGTLYSIGGYAGQAEIAMVFNTTAAPGNGAVTPVAWGTVGGAGGWNLPFQYPLAMSTGITVCYSSNASPLSLTTISTNNTLSAQWQ